MADRRRTLSNAFHSLFHRADTEGSSQSQAQNPSEPSHDLDTLTPPSAPHTDHEGDDDEEMPDLVPIASTSSAAPSAASPYARSHSNGSMPSLRTGSSVSLDEQHHEHEHEHRWEMSSEHDVEMMLEPEPELEEDELPPAPGPSLSHHPTHLHPAHPVEMEEVDDADAPLWTTHIHDHSTEHWREPVPQGAPQPTSSGPSTGRDGNDATTHTPTPTSPQPAEQTPARPAPTPAQHYPQTPSLDLPLPQPQPQPGQRQNFPPGQGPPLPPIQQLFADALRGAAADAIRAGIVPPPPADGAPQGQARRPGNPFHMQFTFDIPLMVRGQAGPGAQAGPEAAAGTPPPPQPQAPNANGPTPPPAMPLNLPPMDLLRLLFGQPPQEAREDPARARRLVAGLEPVSEGLIKRIVRADEGEGGGMCAICWESLEEGGGFSEEEKKADKEGTTKEGGEVSGDAMSVDSGGAQEADSPDAGPSIEKEQEPKLPRVVALPCAHVFHSQCLIPWFARPRQTTCPACRFDVDPEGLTESSEEGANAGAAGGPPMMMPFDFLNGMFGFAGPRPPNANANGQQQANPPAPTQQPPTGVAAPHPQAQGLPTVAAPQPVPANAPIGSHPIPATPRPPTPRAGDDPAEPTTPEGPPLGVPVFDDMMRSFGAYVRAQGNAPIGARPLAGLRPLGGNQPPNTNQQQPPTVPAGAQAQPAPQAHPQPQPQPQPQPVFYGPPRPPHMLPPHLLQPSVNVFDVPGATIVSGFIGIPFNRSGLFPPTNAAPAPSGPAPSTAAQQAPDGAEGSGQPASTPAPAPAHTPNPNLTNPAAAPMTNAQNIARLVADYIRASLAGGGPGPVLDAMFAAGGPGSTNMPPPQQAQPGVVPTPTAQAGEPPAAQHGPTPTPTPTGPAPPRARPTAYLDIVFGFAPTTPRAGRTPAPGAVPTGAQPQPEPTAGPGAMPMPGRGGFPAQLFGLPFPVQVGPQAPPTGGAGPAPPPMSQPHPRQRASGPKPVWRPPPAPGLTLRERIEQRERERGWRCDDVSCGVAPSDEEPVAKESRLVRIRALEGVGHASESEDVGGSAKGKGVQDDAHPHSTRGVCAHEFHLPCLVRAERVAGWGGAEDEKAGEGAVVVGCPRCRAVGGVSREDWEEGARALDVEAENAL